MFQVQFWPVTVGKVLRTAKARNSTNTAAAAGTALMKTLSAGGVGLRMEKLVDGQGQRIINKSIAKIQMCIGEYIKSIYSII